MKTEFLFSLEDNTGSIDEIIDNLQKAVESEEQELNSLPDSMEGGLVSERHKEVIGNLKDAIYALNTGMICIGYALQ